MKNLLIRIGALVLMVWYCFSIIGFDVHTCNASGRSFIATFVSGFSCDDIHPEHTCGKSCCHERSEDACEKGCCSHHDEQCPDHENGLCFSVESCCTDDMILLELTGSLQEQDERILELPFTGLCLADCSGYSLKGNQGLLSHYRYKPDSGAVSKTDIQSILNIWRI